MGATTKYLPREKVQQLSKRSDLWGAWLTLHVWGVIILSGAVFVIWPNPLTFIFAFLMIGSRQHGLSILVHEAAHRALFKSKFLNDFVGQYILAAPYGGDMKSYRKYHLKHHRFTQSNLDPDLNLSAKFPVSRASLFRKLFRDMTGQTFLRLRIATYKMNKGQDAKVEGADAFEYSSRTPYYIANILMFGTLALLGVWWAYFALWLLPLMTWFFAVLRIRNIAEHALTTRDDNPLTHARTVLPTWSSRIFIAPYWVGYHVEHHAYMYVPCYRLKALHKEMTAAGHAPNMEIKKNYLSVLQAATQPA